MMILNGARAARVALLSTSLLFPVVVPAASAGKSAVAVPGKPLVEVDAPGVAANSFQYDSGFIEKRNGSGRASPGGLHASAFSYGAPVLVETTASFASLHDTTFDYEPGDLVNDPTDWVSFILTGALSGTITGTDAGGFGGGSLTLSVSGAIYSAPNFGSAIGSSTVSVTRGGPVNPSEGMSIPVNEIVSLPRVWVPRGQGIQVAATLGANAGGSNHFNNYGGVHANFSDSFHFDPLQMFQIDQPGITVNSPSLGLENNTLPAAIPLPAAVWCLLSGLATMLLPRRRKRLA